ncbi:cutinase-domain-containing protein [Aspergillus eucalypticola CBS 122712]|uniref:Cutinase n=1 Tax=Aspergillus eucalypticola (strain CBS 122712 / IBT 29274) TaxID=1448314 RepID=A0A317UKG8_ASPEC|nr:cutinase-domain-containing protein [Aspergillus eucalypticola CBS 122712]PWY61885.1 cutinase-domain-containing protein [Aspergillus eucalypticola CBS 122712]
MKSFITLSLLATALGAPTSTLQARQFDLSSLTSGSAASSSSGSIGSTGTVSESTTASSGLSALASLFPSSSTSSTTGSTSGTSDSSSSSDGLSSLLSMFSSSGSGSSTENGVTQHSGSCKELTFIFARGTTEIGNMGTVVGPEVASELATLTGNQVTVQGVNYPADWEGNASLGSSGGPTMASYVKEALQECPNTKVVLGGYSQGAMVVHYAANELSADQLSGAVLFGDPLKMESVGKLSSSKVKEFCATGDPVCENGFNVMAHLSYGSDAKEAAEFLVQAAGISS